jgi:DNA-binding transcriptional ArsR family regulator
VKEFITITKALSDVNRVRILLALDGRELCVCQLIVLLGLAPSTVSKHLWILKQAGLVDLRKEGRWSYYHINYESPSELILQAINWTITSNRSSPLIMKDNQFSNFILKSR